MKKQLALALALGLTFSLTACGESATTPDGAPIYKVGMVQLVQHAALDEATRGFQETLAELLPDQVKFNYQNASGDVPMCATIVNQFVASDVDLILANATPALQASASATAHIPVLGTAITDYASALGMNDWTGTVGGNVSGTSNLSPLDKLVDVMFEWVPDAQNIGLMHCSSESNALYQVNVVKEILEARGYTPTVFTFSDSNDLAAVTELAAASCDVIYLPTDNVAAANTGIIDNICRPAGVPVITGDDHIAKGCGLATLSINYYDLGATTAHMALDILVNGGDISAMPIQYAESYDLMYNADIASDLGFTTPSDIYIPIAE